MSEIRLTQTVKSGGCASKLAPGMLSQVLANLPQQRSDRLLVGFDTADDAGVFRISEQLALVQTVDFFTPMVDDPFTFGKIAATNSLSDVYAMGGRPITALATVCFPAAGDPFVLQQIMAGGLSVMETAGCVVLGGHSVRDEEMKFGYAVTGLIHPERVLTNAGARPGDALLFAKALGTGVITTALKQGKAESQWVEAAIASMTRLNADAAEQLALFHPAVHGLTDVTGFGLLGHAREMAFASGVRLQIDPRTVSVLPGALDAIERGCVPAGLHANHDYTECVVEEDAELHLDPGLRLLLNDPQTAGGLLISVAADRAGELVQALQDAGYPATAHIGRVKAGSPKIVLTAAPAL